MTRPPRVALALGSGGARGYAHIGVIDVLKERGYQIVGVAGSSMGALVGGLHCAGALEEYTAWATSLTQRDVLWHLDPVLTAPGTFRANRILARMSDMLHGAVIEELPIPFTAVATDLHAGREVWLQEGPVDAAIRASIAIPGLITPVVNNGRLLADGGLLNPIPVSATASVPADLVVAVSLSGDRRGSSNPAPAREPALPEQWLERLRTSAGRLFEHDDHVDEVVADGVPDDADELETYGGDGLRTKIGRIELMSLSLDAMQAALTRYRLAGNAPDIMITVPKDAARTMDFHKAAPMIEVGRELAEQALAEAEHSA